MKKLCIIMAIVMVFLQGLSALAKTSTIRFVPVQGFENTVQISGQDAPADTDVTIIMLKGEADSFSEDFVGLTDAERDNVAAYVGYCTANSEGVYTSEKIKLPSSGKFTIYANGEQRLLYFFNDSDKAKAVQEYKDPDSIDFAGFNNLSYKELVNIFSLSEEPLYMANSDGVRERFESDYFKQKLNPSDLDASVRLMKDAFILSLFDDKLTSFIFSGNELIASEDLQITSGGDKIAEYADYLSIDKTRDIGIISSDGIKSIKNTLIDSANEYKELSDIKAKFQELVLVNLIMKNELGGYGHIQHVFEKYSLAFSSVKYPSSADKDMYNGLLASGAKSIDDIKKYINNYKKPTPPAIDDDGDNIPGLGPSGGFGGGGGSTGGTTIPTVPPSQISPQTGFGDVGSEHWAIGAIEALSKKGVINGYDDKSFRPENTVTRAEFAKMLVSLLGLDTKDVSTKYNDVSSSDWFAPYIAAATKAGFIMGNDGLFNPNDIISRQDAAIILARAANLKSTGASTFTDSDSISEYAKDAAAAVEEGGLMNGVGDGRFDPLGSLTRAQAATVLFRLSERGVNFDE